MEVIRITTPLTRLEMGQALIAGHRRYFGAVPSAHRLAVAWSQCALEHAAGAKLYNFNLGNVTCGPAWEGDFYVMRVPPPDPPVLRFRAFETAELGAQDYWRMLAGHYRPALRLFDEGHAYDAAFLLGQLGYYTARREIYSNAVANYKAWFDRELAVAYGETLSEGRGNSLLTKDEINQVMASLLQLPIEDRILEDVPEHRTDPDMSTIAPGEDESGKA